MPECMKIMIAYDGSSRAEAALRDLQYAGLPSLAEAKLLSVVEPIIPAGPPDAALGSLILMDSQGETQRADRNVRQSAARLHEAFPDWALYPVIRRGNMALQIVTEAEDWKPKLIVISPLNRSKFERLIFGSFSRNIVENAPCTVRIARHGGEEEARELRILVGYDGSRSATSAVYEVALRQWSANTQVRLVTALELSRLDSFGQSAVKRRLKPQFVEGAAQVLRNVGLRVSTSLRKGKPQRVLLNEAREWGAHCIFVGRNQRNALSRLLLGSTSAAIASQASCSVEVVREERRHWAMASAGLSGQSTS